MKSLHSGLPQRGQEIFPLAALLLAYVLQEHTALVAPCQREKSLWLMTCWALGTRFTVGAVIVGFFIPGFSGEVSISAFIGGSIFAFIFFIAGVKLTPKNYS